MEFFDVFYILICDINTIYQSHNKYYINVFVNWQSWWWRVLFMRIWRGWSCKSLHYPQKKYNYKKKLLYCSLHIHLYRKISIFTSSIILIYPNNSKYNKLYLQSYFIKITKQRNYPLNTIICR